MLVPLVTGRASEGSSKCMQKFIFGIAHHLHERRKLLMGRGTHCQIEAPFKYSWCTRLIHKDSFSICIRIRKQYNRALFQLFKFITPKPPSAFGLHISSE
ncbi:hypothetical protein Dimus_022011 [Dionaea muscipula]